VQTEVQYAVCYLTSGIVSPALSQGEAYRIVTRMLSYGIPTKVVCRRITYGAWAPPKLKLLSGG
jgi:hypothetical protein